jgi:membrane fusion protein (multidrug efflux system)
VIAILNDTAERATVAEASQAYKRYNELAKLNIASDSRRDEEEARLQVAESSLAERVIRAPFDGVLGMVNVDVGDLVSPGVVITTIDNLDPLEIEFSIPEQDIANVAVEMPITAISEAYKGEIFQGNITAIDTRIDPSTRALRVKAIIPNADRRLKPGMLMKTNIVKETRPAMILPEGVILSKGNQKSVLAIGKNDKKEDIAVEKIVTLGVRQSGFVEIKTGLNEGDKIIVEGQLKAQPDTQVKVIETKSIDDLVGMAIEYSVERKQEALKPTTTEEPKPQESTTTAPEPEVETEVETDTSKQAVSPLRVNPETTNTGTNTGTGE